MLKKGYILNFKLVDPTLISWFPSGIKKIKDHINSGIPPTDIGPYQLEESPIRSFR